MKKAHYVKMKLSERGYKRFSAIMKRMGFLNEDLFLRYCVSKAIKPLLNKSMQKELQKEIDIILANRRHTK